MCAFSLSYSMLLYIFPRLTVLVRIISLSSFMSVVCRGFSVERIKAVIFVTMCYIN